MKDIELKNIMMQENCYILFAQQLNTYEMKHRVNLDNYKFLLFRAKYKFHKDRRREEYNYVAVRNDRMLGGVMTQKNFIVPFVT